jgi:hypothetical protein
MPTRTFPFIPRNTKQLELGDLIAVPIDSLGWGCLQVTDLKTEGPGSQSVFVAGVLPWRGANQPEPEDIAGLSVVEQGLTGKELFVHGQLQVVANAPLTATSLPSNFSDFDVGIITKVWGWQTAIRRVAQLTNDL